MKDPRDMTASQINAELDRLDKAGRKFIDDMIAAGRGHERFSDWSVKKDPLSVKGFVLWERASTLRDEIRRRTGGDYDRMPARLTGGRRRNPIDRAAHKGPFVLTGRRRGLFGYWTGANFSRSKADALPFPSRYLASRGIARARQMLAGQGGMREAMRVDLRVEALDVYKGNPVAPLESQLDEAGRAYSDFTGHAVKGARRIKVRSFRVGWPLGRLDGVMYSTVRDGKREKYLHKFRSQSRPHLIVSHDGASLGIVGGRFQVTEAGIEDA